MSILDAQNIELFGEMGDLHGLLYEAVVYRVWMDKILQGKKIQNHTESFEWLVKWIWQGNYIDVYR